MSPLCPLPLPWTSPAVPPVSCHRWCGWLHAPFASGLPEARQAERLRVTDAATARAPGLILQRLLDRQSLGASPLIACLHLVYLDDHERPLRGPVIPEVR
jgi:hypothetical protein